MHKLTVLYPSATDGDKFKRYYTGTHIPLVRKMPGIRRINYGFNLEGIEGSNAPFCLFEAWFDDGAAMGAATQSPEGQAVVADVANFAEGPPTMFHGPVEGE